MTTTRQASIGSISSGTLREQDLLDAFADELEHLTMGNGLTGAENEGATNLVWEARELAYRIENDEMREDDEDAAGWRIEELTDALQEYVPPYCYFGAHPGDGADFGFWLEEDVARMVEDNGGIVVSDTSEVPDDYSGEVLHINDHGNATLYVATNGKLDEVWSVV